MSKKKKKALPVFKVVIDEDENTGIEKIVLTDKPLFGEFIHTTMADYKQRLSTPGTIPEDLYDKILWITDLEETTVDNIVEFALTQYADKYFHDLENYQK